MRPLPRLGRRTATPSDRLRLLVLVSGSGSNLQAILDRCAAATSCIDVAMVVSNVAGVRAIDRATQAGKPSLTVPHAGKSREAFDRELVAIAHRVRAELVVLAGFMRILTPHFLDGVGVATINVHPALLPAFPGTHGARQALEYGVKLTGCTVHVVDAGVDTGPILAQAAVPVLPGDDEQTLQARIQHEEHRLLPDVLEAIARAGY